MIFCTDTLKSASLRLTEDHKLSRQRRIINPLPIDYSPKSTVLIFIGGKRIGRATGSILSDRIILTAAHSFTTSGVSSSIPQQKNVTSISVHIGVRERNLTNYERYKNHGPPFRARPRPAAPVRARPRPAAPIRARPRPSAPGGAATKIQFLGKSSPGSIRF